MTGHFDPYPFHSLVILLLWVALIVFSVMCWQYNEMVKLITHQLGAHAKTWTKIEWIDARIDLLQEELQQFKSIILNLKEDHERLVQLTFDEQNMLQASKNQHTMLNDRMIAIAREVESLVESIVKLNAMLVNEKKKKW